MMQFIDLSAQLARIRPDVEAKISSILDHGQFIMGVEVPELESQLAAYVGVRHCVTMASGTTALQVALMAVGVGQGDEVVTTPFSFFGTVEAIKLLGAEPVFVDIDPKTYNLDPRLLAQAIGAKTKAIMPVSLYGQCADFDSINAVAAQHGVAVIEDGAQSFGAQYKGRRSLGLSTIGCTSFFPTKPLGCFGDGGACFTDDDHLAERMRSLIDHGQIGRYHHSFIGMNGRFDTLQAGILSVKFAKLFTQELQLRQQLAACYKKYLQDIIELPWIEPHNTSVYAQYTIEVDERERVQADLLAQGIPSAVHYPKSLHQQPALSEFHHQQHFPVSERAASRVLSLPFYPYLEESEVKQIAQGVEAVLGVKIA